MPGEEIKIVDAGVVVRATLTPKGAQVMRRYIGTRKHDFLQKVWQELLMEQNEEVK